MKCVSCFENKKCDICGVNHSKHDPVQLISYKNGSEPKGFLGYAPRDICVCEDYVIISL